MRIIPKKHVDSKRIKQFWMDYDLGKRRAGKERVERMGGRFSSHRSRGPVAVSPSLLGTVRNFRSRKFLQVFLQNVHCLNNFFSDRKQEHFVFQPLQVLHVDLGKLRVLERVYRSPNVYQLLYDTPSPDSYGGMLCRKLFDRLEKKGVSRKELNSAVQKAYAEYLSIIVPKILSSHFNLDVHELNVLVLDYDPETKKVLLAQVDHGLSASV